MTTQRQFKAGDRVIVNDRNVSHRGEKGTIKYLSGNQYWIKFDGSEQVAPGFYPWWLDPLNE